MNAMKSIPCLVLAVLCLRGCATPPDSADPSDNGSLSSSMRRTASQRILSRLANVDNGLEVRRLIVNGDPGRIGEILMSHALESPLRADMVESFRRNGFRMVAVPLDVLETIETELGPLTMNMKEWHGQVDDWRSLHERRIDSLGCVVAVNGRVRSYRDGRFQLLVRSWVVPMEDGPFLHLDLVPCFLKGGERRVSLLPREKTRRGEFYDRISITLRIPPDRAFVLAYESPNVKWPGDESGSGSSRAGNDARRRSGPGVGPIDSRGPDTLAPTTLGALLLYGETDPPSRCLLVFVPRIAPNMFPPAPAVSSTLSRAGDS